MAKKKTEGICGEKVGADMCMRPRGHAGDHEMVVPPVAPAVERVEEVHVTVEGVGAVPWFHFCEEQGVKPLLIELSNLCVQMMCELDEKYLTLAPNGVYQDFLDAFKEAFPEGRVVRYKRETNVMREDEKPIYFECHVKINGVMPNQRLLNMQSRDLYRTDRWYVTKRSRHPFDAESFVRSVEKRILARRPQQVIQGHEYEVCVEDTNASLDQGWELLD